MCRHSRLYSDISKRKINHGLKIKITQNHRPAIKTLFIAPPLVGPRARVRQYSSLYENFDTYFFIYPLPLLDGKLFKGDDDNFICKIVNNSAEAIALIEAVEYNYGGKLFRKRK
jgi:hypothetical protein